VILISPALWCGITFFLCGVPWRKRLSMLCSNTTFMGVPMAPPFNISVHPRKLEV
jgi:hypothetical protein